MDNLIYRIIACLALWWFGSHVCLAADQEFSPQPGEVEAAGYVWTVDAAHSQFTMAVSWLGEISGKTTSFNPPQSKVIAVGPAATLYVRGDRRRSVTLPQLARGVYVVVIGTNPGPGQPLAVRDGAFWTSDRNGAYSFTPSVTGSRASGSDPQPTSQNNSPGGTTNPGPGAQGGSFAADFSSGEPLVPELAPQAGHTAPVTAIAFSGDHKKLLSGDRAGFAAEWDTRTGELIRLWRAHDYRMEAVAFVPGDQEIATGGADNTVKVWSARTGKLLSSFSTGTQGESLSVAFSPDCRTVARVHNMRVELWNVKTGHHIGDLASTGG